MHCYVERHKIIAIPINSNKFTEFDMKKYKIWLENKKIKKPRNLTFQDFRFFKKPKNLGFLKWVWTALLKSQGQIHYLTGTFLQSKEWTTQNGNETDQRKSMATPRTVIAPLYIAAISALKKTQEAMNKHGALNLYNF